MLLKKNNQFSRINNQEKKHTDDKMEFNKEKFKNVLHYIVYKCGLKNNVGRTVLHKLLYFSDFNYYQIFKESITNESYKKLSRGPVPIHFEEAMAELIEENKKLVSDIAVLSSADRIEKIAVEELGMHKAETEDIVRVEMTGEKK